MAVYTVTNQVTGKPTEIVGERVAVSTTRERDDRGRWPLRWNDQALFELAESGRWCLYRVGVSRVYHTDPTDCTVRGGAQSGEPATVDDLPDDAVPCPRCRPPCPGQLADAADAGDMIGVRYEVPRPSLFTLATPRDVLDRLATTYDRDTTRDGAARTYQLSRPSLALIKAAAEASPRFAAGLAGIDLDGQAAPDRIS